MNLSNKSFEDIIYTIEGVVNRLKQTFHVDLAHVNTTYLKQLFQVFNGISKKDMTLFNYNKDSGFTTAMLFIMVYYSLSEQNITIVTDNKTKMYHKLELIIDFFKLIYPQINKVSSSKTEFQIITDNNDCTIKILSDSFAVNELFGLVMIDCRSSIDNGKKYDDIISSLKFYRKLIMNFKTNDYFKSLAVKNNIEIQDIKFKN